MTHRAVGFGRGFPRMWLVPIGALTLILGVAASGRLSRSIVADLIAWWPVWVGLGITAYLLRERNVGSFRTAGLVPLGALLFIGLFMWGHFAGWSIMPSASQRLVGPELGGFTEATLLAEVDGRIALSGGSEFLYQVEPIKSGGVIGIPGASEQVVDTAVGIVLESRDDPGLYGYAGWDIRVSSGPTWALTLDGALDLDLWEVNVSSLALHGSGSVTLGEVVSETPVAIGGAFRVIVASGTPVRVVGSASVPASWTLTAGGATSPTPGEGWVLTVVDDATLTVAES